MIDQKALDEAVSLELELMRWAKSTREIGMNVTRYQVNRNEQARIIRNYHRIVAQRMETR